MKAAEKTNVMRVLDSKKIPYTAHFYEADPTLTGAQIAALLGEPAVHVFKTLVTQGKSNQYYVFVIPAAKAAGEKSVAMIKQKELLPLTGYVHGGCSPIGMKKAFPTWIHESAAEADIICVSAGRVGAQIELKTDDLCRAVACRLADLV